MTDRHTRSQGPAPDISLPPTRRSTSLPSSRRSRTPASGTQTPTQTHTPPVSSTSQPQPQILSPLALPLSPIFDMSQTGEPETSTQNPEGPVPTPAPPTPVQNTSAPPANPPSDDGHSISSSNVRSEGPTNPNYVMSLTDINKAFDSVTTLTGKDNWKIWLYRVQAAINVIRYQHYKSSGLPPGNTVKHACLNVITGKIDDKIMIHYLDERDGIELINKLKARFDPQTTVHDSNELWRLFNLRRPVWEFDKLLDEATDLFASIKAKDIDASQQVFYSALVGIIPPQYHHVRTAYEASVKAATKSGEAAIFVPETLVDELRNEFNSYRAIHSRTNSSSTSSHKKGGKGPGDKGVDRSEKTKEARANAAAPYSNKKPSDSDKRKCFNCNETGHMTPTCPKPWTEKSKAAMKKKGITRQNKSATKESASVAVAGPSTSTSSTRIEEVSSSAQLDWVQAISSGDVEMQDSEAVVSHHISLPAFTAISDQDQTHIIDSGATIHCTPYLNLLFNIHTTPAITLTVANSEQLELRLAGDMRVEVGKDDSKSSAITLKNVYYNSKLPFTLISISESGL